MESRFKAIRNLQRFFINEMFLLSIFFVIVTINKITPNIVLTISLITILIIYEFVMQEKVHNFYLYHGLCLAPVLLLFLLPVSLIEKILFFAVLAYLYSGAITFWKNNRHRRYSEIPLAIIVCILVLNIYSFISGFDTLYEFTFWSGVIITISQIIIIYCESMMNFLNQNKDTTSFPKKQILTSNNSIVCVLLFVFLFVIILFHYTPLDNTIYFIKDIAVYVIQFLVMVASIVINFFSKDFDVKDDIVNTDINGHLLYHKTFFSQVMETFLSIMQILIGLVILYLIIKLAFKLILKFMKQNNKYDDLIEASTDENIIAPSHIVIKETPIQLNESKPLKKIRRMYKSFVLKHLNSNEISPSNTVDDIETMLSNKDLYIPNTSALYKEARYSNHDVNNIDFNEIDKEIKSL